jgi:hypothetical protein
MGIVTGYGFDHEMYLTDQEEEAFEEFYNKFIQLAKERKRFRKK